MVGLHHKIAICILEMYPGPRSLTALQIIASRIDSRLCTQQSFLNNHRSNSNNSNSKNQFVIISKLNLTTQYLRMKENADKRKISVSIVVNRIINNTSVRKKKEKTKTYIH